MRIWKAFAVAGLLVAQAVWANDAIRLKTRTIESTAETRQPWRGRVVPRETRHFIVQFRSYPAPEVRDQLVRRGTQVLAYVPDNSLMVSASSVLDLEGLDAIWFGPLDPADKISPALATLDASVYVVIFHADVDMAKARALVTGQGFQVLENPGLLPGQLLVIGLAEPNGLAADDDVAYILPASADLVAGNPVMGCAGPLTEAGPLGEYVAVGRGWAKDSGGAVALRYFFNSVTGKLDANQARSEVERAFREWARFANISFSEGNQAAARSIDVLFTSGAHGDAYPFDGPGGVLAHTFYPAPLNTEPVAGDMHFDAGENWHIGAAIDVFTVALHEAGHALGLGHSDNPGSVMYPYYRFATGLTSDDIAGIRNLYGAAGAAQPPAGTPGTPSTPVTPTPGQPAGPSGGKDVSPPSLQIVSPGSTIVNTSAATITLSGTANDNVGVTAVKWTTSTGSSGTASGTAAWSATVPLLVGNNMVTVRAYDAAGNSRWRALTAVRH